MMESSIAILKTAEDIQQFKQKHKGCQIGFVPTMGNLHQGHLSLLDKIKPLVDKIIVSIFVNPTQFSEGEDFATYPRTFKADLQALQQAPCDAIFFPTTDIIYPDIEPEHYQQFNINLYPDIEPLQRALCGISRPHFFAGVVDVVGRLFDFVQPDVSCFGCKDFQQLRILQCFAEKISPNTQPKMQVVAGDTYREPSGLAMSSRNGYLTAQQKQLAASLYQELQTARDKLQQIKELPIKQQTVQWDIILKDSIKRLSKIGFVVDYFEVRKEEDLSFVNHYFLNSRIFIAAVLDSVRLIDNISLD